MTFSTGLHNRLLQLRAVDPLITLVGRVFLADGASDLETAIKLRVPNPGWVSYEEAPGGNYVLSMGATEVVDDDVWSEVRDCLTAAGRAYRPLLIEAGLAEAEWPAEHVWPAAFVTAVGHGVLCTRPTMWRQRLLLGTSTLCHPEGEATQRLPLGKSELSAVSCGIAASIQLLEHVWDLQRRTAAEEHPEVVEMTVTERLLAVSGGEPQVMCMTFEQMRERVRQHFPALTCSCGSLLNCPLAKAWRAAFSGLPKGLQEAANVTLEARGQALSRLPGPVAAKADVAGLVRETLACFETLYGRQASQQEEDAFRVWEEQLASSLVKAAGSAFSLQAG